MSEAIAAPPHGWRAVMKALGNRKTGFMAIFGFAAGLPYSLLVGTLYAWLSDAKVNLETMGVFSLIGLSYAFKFLWSPVLDRVNLPLLRGLGRRKQWIVTAQILIGIILVTLSRLDPGHSLGLFSLLAGIGAFASATQDIAIDAWCVDVADEVATIDMLSTVFQMGYRIAALVGGALALILADRIGWANVFLVMGLALVLAGIICLFAPDSDSDAPSADMRDAMVEMRGEGKLTPKVRITALAMVALLWGWALVTVVIFMVRSLGSDPAQRPDAVAFISSTGPLIVIATIVAPAIIAAVLVWLERSGRYLLVHDAPHTGTGSRAADHLYRALILPLTELVGRMGWTLVLALALVLTYRLCDSIWGTFAYPFYLGELKYSKDEVAIASKFFGVGATVLGLALGGTLLTVLGRMATLALGAVLAAVTNLLYADLALGGAHMAAASNLIGLTRLVEMFGGEPRLAPLMLTIGTENLATGIAGAAYIAWLSSIVSKGYSAVQYALLSSLTLLVGTLGRGALGQMIAEQGYYRMFIFVTWIGMIAVVLTLLEWWRVVRLNRRLAALEG